MTDIEENLISEATALHSTIFPCSAQGEFEYCFTRDDEKVYFWFNTEDQSTHVISAELCK